MKNMPGVGGEGGYGGGRVAWHNVILSDCSFISMHTKVTLVDPKLVNPTSVYCITASRSTPIEKK